MRPSQGRVGNGAFGGSCSEGAGSEDAAGPSTDGPGQEVQEADTTAGPSFPAKANIPLSTIRKFARKTRSYLRAYMKGDVDSHVKVEALVKKFKEHRCALQFDFKFIRDT